VSRPKGFGDSTPAEKRPETAREDPVNRRCLILAAVICMATGRVGYALDIIRTTTDRVALRGEITSVNPLEVELKIGQLTRTVPVNEIISISYDEEPDTLTSARSALLEGRYEDALESLQQLDPAEQQRQEIKQDIEFWTALCRAELALGGSQEISAAGTQMANFVRRNKTSYHWLRANEVVGDLLVAIGEYRKAETYYDLVREEAPWPDYQMRAGVALGRARLAQGETVEALQTFQSVLDNEATGEMVQPQRLAAKVGKGRCLAAEGKHEEAIGLLKEVISNTTPEQVELTARAYNALGTAYRASGQTKEALFAFLHVDVLYSIVPETHAEALANLVELWEEIGRPARATHDRQILEQRYGSIPWAGS
jgi:tetratricopeptide (TPR) repeat protein